MAPLTWLSVAVGGGVPVSADKVTAGEDASHALAVFMAAKDAYKALMGEDA